MAIFGKHETAQRLYLSGVGGLYTLKGDEKKVIKVIQPTPGVWSDTQLREEIDAFLLRYKTQKALAKASQSWAPVHEVSGIKGVVEEGDEGPARDGSYFASGAYVVMDRHERTCETLIDGRVNLNNDDLRNIMSGTIKGLRDIRTTAKRPHGALKPENILLQNTTDLAQATVHLTDPAPDGSLGPTSDNKDYADLAKILYELVNLRPYGGGTIPRTKDWDELGPNGEDWRKLCNTLLDVGAGHGSAEDRDLEKLLGTIDKWREKPKKSKLPMVAAAVVAVLVLGGVAAYILMQPPKLAFDEANWQKLCLSYDAWFGDFMDKMDEGTKKKYSAAPYPTEVVKLLEASGSELGKYSPDRIAKKPQLPKDLSIDVPDAAKTGGGPYYTKKSVELIDNVSEALTPAKWQVLTSLDQTATAYEKRGWARPAAGIRSVIAGAKPPALPDPSLPIAERWKKLEKSGKTDFFANVENTIQAGATVTEIETKWAGIQDQIKKLQAVDVPLIKALPQFAEDLPKSGGSTTAPGTGGAEKGSLADVKELAGVFTRIEQLATQLNTELNRKDQAIEFSELAKDPAAKVPEGGKITVETYAAFAGVLHDYVKLAQDPRTTVQWASSLDEIQKEIIDKIKEANPQDPNLGSLESRRKEMLAEVAAFTPISPIEKNRKSLDSLVAKAKDELGKLQRDGNEWVAPYIIDPAQYIAKQQAAINGSPLAKATPAVFQQWKKAHSALLAKVSAAPQELKKFRVFKAVDGKFASLEKIYGNFDAKIPAKVPELSEINGEPWQRTIAARVATVYREQALQELMTAPALKWSDDLPQVDDPAYQSFESQRLKQYEQMRGAAVALINDYATVQSRLDHLYLLPNQPAAGDKSWRDILAGWKAGSHPLLGDAEIAAALKPIGDRAGALMALDSVTDYKGLAGQALSKVPEIALTAWRKISQAPVSEELPVLDDEEKMEGHLTGLFVELAKDRKLTAQQVNDFGTEMKAQRPMRWHRYAGTLTSAATIQLALDRRAQFAVTLNPQADAPLVFNDALYQLRKNFEKNLKEPELKAVSQQFIQSVQAMPDSVRKDKNIEALLARIAKPLTTTNEESSSAGAGPKLAGWEQDANPNSSVRIFYYPNKASARRTLEFARLQVGEKTVYVCTSEVPLGLFADAVNNGNKFADLDNHGKPANQNHWFTVSGDPWEGPRVWKVADRKFTVNDDWLFKAPLMGETSSYPGQAPRKPAMDDPMQALSPWSAMYVARLLGCRLPTSDEWMAAYEKFEAAGGPKDAWNLRGAAWQAQWDYSKKMASKGMQYPDQGIFLQAEQLFAGITAEAAKPWQAGALAKMAPNRINAGGGAYAGSLVWFRPVGTQPGAGAAGTGSGAFHDLVGNVAEYVLDAPGANAVVKDASPTVDWVNATINAGGKQLYVIGGSSLSPPEVPFNVKQPVDPDFAQTASGFSDVGFRLAYTAPIDSIADVLATVFKAPPYLATGRVR